MIIVLFPVYLFLHMYWLQDQIFRFRFTQGMKLAIEEQWSWLATLQRKILLLIVQILETMLVHINLLFTYYNLGSGNDIYLSFFSIITFYLLAILLPHLGSIDKVPDNKIPIKVIQREYQNFPLGNNSIMSWALYKVWTIVVLLLILMLRLFL